MEKENEKFILNIREPWGEATPFLVSREEILRVMLELDELYNQDNVRFVQEKIQSPVAVSYQDKNENDALYLDIYKGDLKIDMALLKGRL